MNSLFEVNDLRRAEGFDDGRPPMIEQQQIEASVWLSLTLSIEFFQDLVRKITLEQISTEKSARTRLDWNVSLGAVCDGHHQVKLVDAQLYSLGLEIGPT